MISLSVKFKSSSTGKSINVSFSNERILLLPFLVNLYIIWALWGRGMILHRIKSWAFRVRCFGLNDIRCTEVDFFWIGCRQIFKYFLKFESGPLVAGEVPFFPFVEDGFEHFKRVEDMFLFVWSIVVNELRFFVGKVIDHLLELFEGLKVRGGHNWV